MKKLTLIILIALTLSCIGLHARGIKTASAADIVATKHNLSTSGPGPVKATLETQICIFCHTPHGGMYSVGGLSTPLWNHTLTTASYTVPSNTSAEWATMLSTPQNPPDGDSRLCLSCHDGTVAIGSVVNYGGTPGTISMSGTAAGGKMPAGTSNLGTDLSGHHPVSIEVNDQLRTDKVDQCNNFIVSWQICYPRTSVAGQTVRLRPTSNQYGSGSHTNLGVQCSSCHDPHNDTPVGNKFLRAGTPANQTPLCTVCHVDCFLGCP